MTEPEAKALVARLMAAFPSAKIAAETVQVYVEELAALDADAGLEAVKVAARSSAWFPTLSVVLEAYWVAVEQKRSKVPQLLEPPVTEEERARNLERLYDLRKRYAGVTKEMPS